MLELRQLRYFRTLAETLHFGKTAKIHHMSQPPLSRQIAALEQELGVRLFERTRHNVKLTEAGKHFFEDTGEIFKLIENARRNAQLASRGETGSLSVGFMMSSAYNIMPAVAKHYSATYPEVVVKLTEVLPSMLAADVKDGKTDVGIMYRPEDCDGLESRTIYREPLVLALPPGHRLGKKSVVFPHDLAEESFITFPRHVAPLVHDQIVHYCLANGFRPRVKLETNLQQTIVNLVGEGMGVAMVPRSMSKTHRTTQFRRLKAPPIVEVAVLWSKYNTNPCVETFVSSAVAVQHELKLG
jgi:DNA-binding transcriptional LysR family regulator